MSLSLNIRLSDGKKSEADLILWYQRKMLFGTDYPTEIVFGEAKSFGKDAFNEKDIERMQRLASEFPGAVLVFATMKEAEELSAPEIRHIKRLAEWGREYDRDRLQIRAPVILLTGTELFAAYSLEQTWKEKGGEHAGLVQPASVRIDNLRNVADMTQQLYLKMPSYSRWLDSKWKNRAELWKRRQANKTDRTC